MSLIEIRDVHKRYGEFHVLKGISERVEKGEVLVIRSEEHTSELQSHA